MTATAGEEGHSRPDLLRRVGTQGRLLNLAMTGLSHAAAAQLSLQPIDQQCVGLLNHAGPMTVGRLAQLAGLTASSITGVIDRLEGAGLARREADPHDRRRVLVVPLRSAAAEQMFAPMRTRMARLHESYTNAELELIGGYLENAARIMQEHAAQIRSRPARSRPTPDQRGG